MRHNKPKKPRHKRTIGDIVQDIKHKRRAKKGSRKIKRSLKDSASKASSSVNARRDSREARLRVKSKEKTEAKWVKGRWSKEDKEYLREAGLEGLAKSRPSRLKKSKPTAGARRAKRVLGRMDKREQRKIGRKQGKGRRRTIQDAEGKTSRNASQGIQCGPKGCSAK